MPVSLCALLFGALAFASSHGDEPAANTAPKAAPVALRVLPASLRFAHLGDRQGVLVVADYADGSSREVTSKVRWGKSEHVRIDGGELHAARAGHAQLRLRLGSLEAELAVHVDAAATPRLSFRLDVLPTLTKQGCNAGGCHGAARGKNGFGLSLFGYDPARDYRSLTRELDGRRVDVFDPARSLLLSKPTTRVAHKGGRRLREASDPYETILAWVRDGARPDPASKKGAQPRRVLSLEILPRELVLPAPGERVRLVIRAKYADGRERDVTRLALLSSRDPTVVAVEEAAVDAAGATPRPKLVAKGPGESFILARFDSLAVGTRVLVHDPARASFAWPKSRPAPRTLVDRHVEARLRRLRRAPSPRCTDEVFVRRLYIDLLGRLPRVEEAASFLKDTREDKRARLVDALLEQPEFFDYLALEWAEALRIESTRLYEKGARAFESWLRDALHRERPFDEVVREIVTARGSNFENPPASLFVVERDAKLIGEHVAQVFLGIRMQCAQCHDHPFERWTMDDYYGFGAFFARVTNKRGEDFR